MHFVAHESRRIDTKWAYGSPDGLLEGASFHGSSALKEVVEAYFHLVCHLAAALRLDLPRVCSSSLNTMAENRRYAIPDPRWVDVSVSWLA